MEDTHSKTINAIKTLKTWARQYVHPDLEELVDRSLHIARLEQMETAERHDKILLAREEQRSKSRGWSKEEEL